MRTLTRRATIVVLCGAVMTAVCHGQQPVVRTLEYRVKAAFLCKFVGYVQWPSQVFGAPDSPLVIGVMAADTVLHELARSVAAQSDTGRPLEIRKLRADDAVDGVHVLFVARSEDANLEQVMNAAKGLPVLVVTESGGPPGSGSMINFVVVENKVKFDIAPEVAQSSRLHINARLLAVARRVIRKS